MSTLALISFIDYFVTDEPLLDLDKFFAENVPSIEECQTTETTDGVHESAAIACKSKHNPFRITCSFIVIIFTVLTDNCQSNPTSIEPLINLDDYFPTNNGHSNTTSIEPFIDLDDYFTINNGPITHGKNTVHAITLDIEFHIVLSILS